MQEIQNQARAAALELIAAAKVKPGEIFIIGCSTSEVMGKRIGSAGAPEAASAILDGLLPVLSGAGLYPAVQCCEHLNRAIVLPRKCLEAYALDEVCVLPKPNAGGSLASAYYEHLGADACVVESVRAHLGMDIGGTLIGMQLRPVAVPVRLSSNTIGEAQVIFARTRPKLIGGARARYPGEIR